MADLEVMEWTILAGCLLGAWALLTMLGSERQQRIDDLHEKARITAEIAKQQADAAEEPIVLKSK